MNKLESLLQGWVQKAAERRWLPTLCALLAALGTLTAAFPVTIVVLPAVLLAPTRWGRIALAAALGSSLGATALVEIVHLLGLPQLETWFPQLLLESHWVEVRDWVETYGILSLFLIMASPLPQTPVLIFIGMSGQAILPVLIAVFCGKVLKYAGLAWLASHFPKAFPRWQAFLCTPSPVPLSTEAKEHHAEKH